MMGISEVAHVCDDHVTIYSPSAQSIESSVVNSPSVSRRTSSPTPKVSPS